MRLPRDARGNLFFAPDGASHLDTGEHALQWLGRLIVELTEEAQNELNAVLGRWAWDALVALGPGVDAALWQERLERAVMSAGNAAAEQNIRELAEHFNGLVPPDTLLEWKQTVAAGSHTARKARNLINHRRRAVNAVLDALIEPEFTSVSSRKSRPRRSPEIDELRARPIRDAHDYGRLVADAFDVSARDESSERSISEAMRNNLRLEWLDFVSQFAPDLWLDARDARMLQRRSDFDRRLDAALRDLVWSMRPVTSQMPAASQPDSHWKVVSAPVVAAPTPQVPAPELSSVPPVQQPEARLEIRRGQGMTTFIVGPDVIGNRDIDDLALELSLNLLDPNDPTEIQVRALAGSAPQLEVVVWTSDATVVAMAFKRAKRLLA